MWFEAYLKNKKVMKYQQAGRKLAPGRSSIRVLSPKNCCRNGFSYTYCDLQISIDLKVSICTSGHDCHDTFGGLPMTWALQSNKISEEMKKPPLEIPRSSSICARRAFNGSQPATKSRAEALGWRIYANSPEKRRDVSLGFSKGWLRVRAAGAFWKGLNLAGDALSI